MIDVVFLLLIFFVMTFKVVELEGDFSIRMPAAGDSSASVDPLDLPLKLRLQSDDKGTLTSMSLDGRDLGTGAAAYDGLRSAVINAVGTSEPVPGEKGPEIEIDSDYNLRYEYVINAITAVSGYKDGNQVVKLIEQIKFAKPRR